MEASATAPGDFPRLANLLQQALLLVADNGVIHDANGPAQRLLQRSEAELKGRPLADFAEGGSDQVTELLRRAARTRSFAPASLSLRRSCGSVEPCRCDGALYRMKEGHGPTLVVLRLTPKREAASEFLVLRDKIRALSKEVAARRAAEEALRESSERYRVTLESIGDAVIATDPDGLIEFMNLVAQELTGWTLEDAIGRHLDEVFVILNEHTREKVEGPVAKVLRMGTAVGLANHTLLVRRDGSEMPIDDSGAPIRGGGRAPRGVVLVFRDLTQRHELERELLAKTASLQEADRRKNEFLSMLAHELRNPLAPVRTGIEVLRRRTDAETVQRVTAVMGRQIDHIVRLVDDLLDVSRLTQGKIELRFAAVTLANLLEGALEMVRPVFEQAGVELRVVSEAPGAVVQGDATRLVQVLGNLLTNAAKFSARGQVVRLCATAGTEHAEIAVVDQGAGISAQNLDKVFQLFFQEEQGLDRGRGGLGVGLTISRSIVEMHAGTLRVASDGPGRGSTFTVKLPLAGSAGGVRGSA